MLEASAIERGLSAVRGLKTARSHHLAYTGIHESFEADGYMVIKGLLGPLEVGYYRSALLSLVDSPAEPEAFRTKPGAFVHVDGVTQREAFWPLIFNERLLTAVRDALGCDICYIRHADLHVNHPLSPSWHHDAHESSAQIRQRLRTVTAEFKILRAAIYLSQGMVFGVIAGSHRHSSPWKERWARVTNSVNKVFGRIWKLHVFAPPVGPRLWLHLDPGDCVLFDVRLLHTGHRPAAEKCAVFLTYGAPNIHSVLHERNYLNQPKLKGIDMPPALQWRLAETELDLGGRARAGDAQDSRVD